MSVVGFDFGNESCVIACIRSGRIEVLQNSSGKRKTWTCVGFKGNQRLIAGDGITTLTSNYKNSITVVKRLLGRKANKQFFEEEGRFLTTKVTEEKNGMMVSVRYDSTTRQFGPESLCAMQLGKLKKIAEEKLGIAVKDCVIGVPAYWNDQQRRAMLTAAKIAGLNVMRLMNETTAVALNYGILRKHNAEKKVLFFDMGYSSLNIAVVSVDKDKLQVLATSHDANLGGRDFDLILMEHFAGQIKKKYKMDVLSEPKPSLKLRKESTRVKKILSANKKAVFNVEYIMNDTDVKGEVMRDQFEKLCEPLIARMLAPLDEVLSSAGLTKKDLHSVEVVGGAVRVPMVKAKLTEWFEGKAVSTTCDGDESIARGCALQCAMLAPFVKVRDFEVKDITHYPFKLYWQPYSASDERPLTEIWDKDSKNVNIAAGSPIPQTKAISFKDKTEPFQVIARYSADATKLPPDTETFLGRWVVSNIPAATHPSSEGKPPKIKLNFQLDLNGLFSVSSVTSIERWEVEVEEEVKVLIEPEQDKTDKEIDSSADKESSEKNQSADQPKDEVTQDQPKDKNEDQTNDQDSATTTTTTTEQASDQPQDENADQVKDDKKEENKDDGNKDKTKEDDKPKYKFEKIKKMVQKKNKIDIPVKEEFIPQMDESSFQIWRKEELTMIEKDREIRETEELRNSLEGYVLEMRGRLEGSLGQYMKDNAREKFIKELNDMEEWLYEDGYDAEKSAFEDRLKSLKLSGDPVDRRSNEAKRRPEVIRSMNRAIAESKALAQSKDKKYDHIPAEDREKAMKQCKETEEWLKNELKKQDPLTLADDPVVLCDAIERKKGDTIRYCQTIMNKPKPEPKKKEKR